jgi:hypothetical protein
MSEIRFDERVVREIGGVACTENLESEDGCRRTVEFVLEQFGLMIVTPAEGEAHGIRANAVAPAARTRMLRRAVDPGALEPEQVVPGVLFLASDQCAFSGKVLEAAGGEFDVARWASSDEVDFGREPVAPEVIAEHWAEIEGMVRS